MTATHLPTSGTPNFFAFNRGTPGSVRLDVVEGPLGNPSAIYDFKFGEAGLSQGRISDIQTAVGRNAPVIEIRPGALPSRANGLGAAYNLSQDIGSFFGGGDSANGGFLLYPNKSNTNMTQSVYAK